MEASYVIEQLENLKRAAERGLKMAHRDGPPYPSNSQFIDLFQHLLDEINRTRDYAEATSDYNMMQAARRDGRGQD